MPFAIGAAVASAGAGIIGGVIQAGAAADAADAVRDSNGKAIAATQAQYERTRADLDPYNQAGISNLSDYQNYYKTSRPEIDAAYNNLQAAVPQDMTEANLIQTPGYAFNLSQGMKAIASSASAKGLGVSGAAMKASGAYATGLSDNTYKTQFDIQQQKFNDRNTIFGNALQRADKTYNYLEGPVKVGENAAAKTGDIGSTTATNVSGLYQNTGQAIAAGDIAEGKAYAGIANSVGNAASDAYGMYNQSLVQNALINKLNGTTPATGTPSTAR